MLRLTVFLVVLGFSVAVETVSAEPVQWKYEDGGNGHYYEFIAPSRIRWTEAKVAAEGRTFLDTSGHLATITSQGEWDFVIAQFPSRLVWIGLSDAAQEGNFEWVTGESFDFTAWGPNEPNNQGDEDYVHYGCGTGGCGWNDWGNRNSSIYGEPLPYVVEYPVPEPSSLILLATAALGLFACGWRKRRR